MGFKIDDHLDEVSGKIRLADDMALGLMAADIERLAKQKAPVRKGFLYSSIRHKRTGEAHFQVGAGEDGPSMAYARYQEFGGDGTREVRNYTKGGTGAHYLRDSGDKIYAETKHYFNTAYAAHGLK